MFRNTDTELFLDDHAIADTVRLERVWRQPRKFGPVLTPDRPWEKHCVIMYGSILPRPEGTGYQAWYQTFSTHVRGPERAVFCYAESDDGVTWEKPVIGDYEWQGSRDNNIFFIHPDTKWLSTLTVACDVDEPDESRRYKLLHSMHTYDEPGICVMFSADGKHWQPHDEPVLANASDRTTLLHAPGRDAPWIAYCRRHGMMQEHRSRIVYRSESADFVDWSDPEPCLAPDLEDSWDQQFYAMPAFRYRNLYLAGVQRLWSTPDTLDVELIVSRDTVNWTRSRNTFLPVGSAGEWDCAALV